MGRIALIAVLTFVGFFGFIYGRIILSFLGISELVNLQSNRVPASLSVSRPSVSVISEPSAIPYPVPVIPAPVPSPQIIYKSKEALLKEQSQQVVKQIRDDMQAFKSQYKKPPECYDMKDDATRIHCANLFMQARSEYEASHK